MKHSRRHSRIATLRPRKKIKKKHEPQKIALDNPRNGLLTTNIADEKMFDSVDKLVRGIVADHEKIGKQELLTGIRHVHHVKGTNETKLQKMLLDITRSVLAQPCATKSPVVNWINSPVLSENSPAIIIASKQNTRSLPWVEGRIHRDHTTEEEDVLSFEVFLDDIDENTGAIRVWENSMDTELDDWKKNRLFRR